MPFWCLPSLATLLFLAISICPRLSAAETLAGRVIDGQTLQPIAGAELNLSSGQSARSSPAGYYRIENTPKGQVTLRARAAGYEAHSEKLRIPEGGKFDHSVILLNLEAAGEIIEVRAKSRAPKPDPPAKQEISREEITRIPGSRGDALQSVKSLPGIANVQAQGNGPGQIVIRGSAPEDSKIMIDGIKVPLLYHFFGFQSVLPSEFIDSIEYIPGGFGANEGNATGGIINVKTRKITTDTHKSFAELSFVNLAGMIRGPISKKHNLHYGFAARRSLIDFVLPLAIPDDVNLQFLTAPVYYDTQLRVDWQPNYKHRVSFFGYGSSDRLSLLNNEINPNEPDLVGGIENSTRFLRENLSWHYENDDFESRVIGSLGQGGFEVDIGPGRFFDLTAFSGQLRSDQSWTPNPKVNLRTGLDLQYRRSVIEAVFPFPPVEGSAGGPQSFSNAPTFDIDQDFINNVSGGYLLTDLRVGDDTSITPGIRLDYYHRFNAAAWGPRIAVQHRIREGLVAKLAMGHYNRGLEQAESFTTTLRPEEATQYVLGGEYKFAHGFSFQSSLYYTDRRKLVGQDAKLAQEDPQNSYVNLAYGRSFGVETTLRAQRERFFGWITYTAGRSDRVDTPISKRRLFDYDQTHNVVALGSYKLGNWQFGGRFQLSTGRPRTPVIGSRYFSDLDIYVPDLGAVNSARFRSDHQFDIRIDRRWNFEEWNLQVYLDITNVYANPRLIGLTYNFDYSETSEITEVPILPALGVRGSF